MFSFFLAISLLASPPVEGDGRQLVITKDVTVTAEQHYETVVVIGGKVDFFGQTEKLYLLNGDVILESGSVVTDQIFIVAGQISQKDGASIPPSGIHKISTDAAKNGFDFSWAKNFQFPSERTWLEWIAMPFVFVFKLILFLAVILIGGLVLSIAPGLSRSADRSLQENPWRSFFVGLTSSFLFFPIIGLLAISIVGILFIPVVGFLYVLFLAAGAISVARALGSTVIPSKSTGWSTLIGIGLMLFIVSVPYIGGIVGSILLLTGLGAFIRSIFDNGRNRMQSNIVDTQSYSI